jgi:hypothetical protein
MSDDELVTRRAHLAFGVLEMLAGLAFFVLLYGVLDLVADRLFGGLGLAPSGSKLVETTGYIESIWTLLPFIVLVLLGLRLLSRAAFESRGGAR